MDEDEGKKYIQFRPVSKQWETGPYGYTKACYWECKVFLKCQRGFNGRGKEEGEKQESKSREERREYKISEQRRSRVVIRNATGHSELALCSS